MNNKYLAFLDIKIKNNNKTFNEQYTVLKKTTIYLPNNLILKIEKVNRCSIVFSLLNCYHDYIICNQELSLCCNNCYTKNINCECNHYLFSINLCSIKTLKPICHNCCCDEYQNYI